MTAQNSGARNNRIQAATFALQAHVRNSGPIPERILTLQYFGVSLLNKPAKSKAKNNASSWNSTHPASLNILPLPPEKKSTIENMVVVSIFITLNIHFSVQGD